MAALFSVPPLAVRRLGMLDADAAADPASHLGALAYGAPFAGADLVPGRLLGAPLPRLDAWTTPGPLQHGASGSVRWCHNGAWLWGALEIEAAEVDADIEAAAERAYADVFATLAATGCGELLRLWNYLPGIHADDAGLERYRRFNIGRQRAFVSAGHTVTEGAPAACALGTRAGPLCLRFLAGRSAPLAVENPRQVSAYHYPEAYGPRSPTFSRAALADVGDGRVALFISGTASIVGHESVHLGDVRAQTRETLANLQAIVDAAGLRTTARFDRSALQATVYLRHAADLPAVRDELVQALGADAPTLADAVLLEGDVCRRELLVEIEAHAVAPGVLRR